MAAKILAFRKNTTYGIPLPEVGYGSADPDGIYFHTHLTKPHDADAGTVTGRLLFTDPALQQLLKRDKDNAAISAIVPT